ncbi:MAG TPA: diacylglycerol kinase family protein [Ktedonobacterales bacterium]
MTSTSHTPRKSPPARRLPRPAATPPSAPPPAPIAHTQDAAETLAASPLPHRAAPPRAGFLRSFVYAGRGLWYAIRTQRNARVHTALAVCAIALGLALRISPVEFAMLFVAITGVFVAEMFNTVAEACVDLATQEYHPLARIAKDVAAGAVLLNAMLSVVIALLVFVPHLWPLLARLF